MQVPLVMTVIGRDRPGLVESVARLVADYGGNWLESRMCRLGGEFAGILRVHVDSAQQESLRQALEKLPGLSVTIQPGEAADGTGAGRLASLDLIGQDRPGIVRQISQALARQGVNVEELRTECASAPMSGETLFKAQARLHIPGTCNVAELRGELEKIAADLLVEINFAELADAKS